MLGILRAALRELTDHEKTDREHNDGWLATVVLPEFIPNHWWESPLHNQTAWLLKAALFHNRRRGNLERAAVDALVHSRKQTCRQSTTADRRTAGGSVGFENRFRRHRAPVCGAHSSTSPHRQSFESMYSIHSQMETPPTE
ncbi:MAG: hypothetical protein JW929_05325 [Anaerolineales bacterium]|nr:hypothetical protein [Anaerolineales bacterium]